MASTTASLLQIRLFGSLHVMRGDEAITTFRSDAQRVLLAYLAAHQGTPQRRDTLAALLTPDRDNKAARKYLRNRLERLRLTIGDRDAEPPYLLTDRNIIGLVANEHVSVDVVEFARLIGAVQQHRHRTLAGCSLCVERLQLAAAFWRGELLAGLNYPSDIWEEWLYAQRAQLKQDALWALGELAAAQAVHEQWQAMLATAQKQLTIETWHENAHRQLIKAHLKLGNRPAAVAQLDACRRILWDELGIEPEPETEALIDDGSSPEHRKTQPSSFVLHNLPASRLPFFGRIHPLTELQFPAHQPAKSTGHARRFGRRWQNTSGARGRPQTAP